MSDVPETPKEFFTDYVPKRFDAIKSGLAGKSSAGSMVFRVTDGGGEWTYRLTDGELVVSDGMEDDVILQVTVPKDSFKPVMVRGAELQEGEEIRPEAQVMAFKALTADKQRTDMVRAIEGSVAFVISDGSETHNIVITPGKGEPKLDAPDCKLECQMSDFMDMQTGKANPMQLAMGGKIRIVGNAQIPMALSGVLA